MPENLDDRVSRRRYERECNARSEAEALLEKKSRELFLANQELAQQSAKLEKAVEERTADLRHALEVAEAASTARSRFIATMSHEIRTPLGGLLGMIDLLSMDEADPGKLELLNYAKAAGTGLSRIVNDVLDFSKMEAGVFLFEQENVDIRALIESIRILIASNQHGADRKIICRIDDSVPKLFLGDATRIRQVISNLVNNALRYSTDGPIIVRASATDHAKGALLRVEVEDFGVGIDECQINNLFKDFSQIANPLTAAAQGTGLGLAISKRIVNGIGGTISVESTFGEGSTFWFEIPVAVVTNAHASGRDGGNEADRLAPVAIEGLRVLIAEDNVINQKLLLTYADRMGLKPDLAENGRIALDKFAPGKYDLVLMDIAMPEMDGLEATRRIRERWSGERLPPIFALTAHVADAIETEARSAGIDRILSKPIPFEELKTAISLAVLPDAAQPDRDGGVPRAVAATDEPAAAGATVLDLMSPEARTELLSFVGAERVAEYVRDFVKDCGERLEKLSAADRDGNAREVREQAHALRGSALLLGFTDLVELGRRIEFGDLGADDGSVAGAVAEFRKSLGVIDAALNR
ncbi:ATP-binding protein [Thioclava sp. FR2]|uniref:ATP-binding protein n=1 Tax=Thioclava sp. FR2 TaxID=3445780 RepID=UPI003EBC3B7D